MGGDLRTQLLQPVGSQLGGMACEPGVRLGRERGGSGASTRLREGAAVDGAGLEELESGLVRAGEPSVDERQAKDVKDGQTVGELKVVDAREADSEYQASLKLGEPGDGLLDVAAGLGAVLRPEALRMAGAHAAEDGGQQR